MKNSFLKSFLLIAMFCGLSTQLAKAQHCELSYGSMYTTYGSGYEHSSLELIVNCYDNYVGNPYIVDQYYYNNGSTTTFLSSSVINVYDGYSAFHNYEDTYSSGDFYYHNFYFYY